MDLDWIIPSLGIGARVTQAWIAHLARDVGVGFALDLRAERPEARIPPGMAEWAHIPVKRHAAPPREALWSGVMLIRRWLAGGGRVLVHCDDGTGASATLVCCALVSRGGSAAEALGCVKAARPKASPSPDQLESILLWSDDWCRAIGERRRGCSWDDLARIAYRADDKTIAGRSGQADEGGGA